jgi:hypothetical protein
VNYTNKQYKDTISGHGNSTWSHEKKAYKIILGAETDLLGMGTASSWILLANAYDETNIRNKLIYDFSQKTGLQWSPECEYVDLYINGEYKGMYLLSERVELGESRLNISTEDNFLFECKMSWQWSKSTTGFQTNGGRDIVVKWPNKCTEEQLSVLQEHIEMVEEMLLEDGNEQVFEYIDLESWARRYLVDEVFCNRDGEKFSSYFYWDYSEETNKIYAGPIWDYDCALGNITDTKKTWDTPNRLLSKMEDRIWYTALMKKDIFRERVIEIYTTEFIPLLDELLETEMDYLVDLTSYAENMNSIRWKGYLSTIFESREDAVRAMKNFLEKRIEFLDSAWCDNVTYYTVTVDVGEAVPYYYEVEANTAFSQLPNPEELGIEGFVGWYDESTGEEFDEQMLITEDKVIQAQIEETVQGESEAQMIIIQYIRIHRQILLTLGLCALLGLTGMAFIYLDIKHNRKGDLK